MSSSFWEVQLLRISHMSRQWERFKSKNLCQLGDLCTHLSKSTDQVTITLFCHFCENYIILWSTYWHLLNCLCEDPWSWRNSLRKVQPLALEASVSAHSQLILHFLKHYRYCVINKKKLTYDRLIGGGVCKSSQDASKNLLASSASFRFEWHPTISLPSPHYRTFTVSTGDVDVKTIQG